MERERARKLRMLLWVGWPLFAIVVGVSVLHFLQFRRGWHLHMEELLSPYGLLHLIPLLLLPAVVLELVLRSRRARG
jgi:hypothetical protein